MYIVFEGPDGAGKTGMTKILQQAIKRHSIGLDIHTFHQPGSTPLGEAIRAAVKNEDVKASPYAQFYLMVADHSQFAEECLKPIFFGSQGPDNYVIIQDRHSAISGYAYQIFVNGIDQYTYDTCYQAKRFKPYVPDAICMLNVSLEETLRRLSKRKSQPGNDRFEKPEVLAKVIKGYRAVPEFGIYPPELYLQVNSNVGKQLAFRNVVEALYNCPRITRTFMGKILEKILEDMDKGVVYYPDKDRD